MHHFNSDDRERKGSKHLKPGNNSVIIFYPSNLQADLKLKLNKKQIKDQLESIHKSILRREITQWWSLNV